MGEWPVIGHSGSDSGLENRGGEMNKDPGAVTVVQPVPTAEGVSNPAEVGGREGVMEPNWGSALPSLSWVCDLGCGSGHSRCLPASCSFSKHGFTEAPAISFQ